MSESSRAPCKYLMMMEPPPKEMGYWPEGIGVAAPGNAHMADSRTVKWRGSIDVLIEEHGNLMRALIGAEVPLIIVPYPATELFGTDFSNGQITQDVEFMRDPSLGAQRGAAMILEMGAPSRKGEAKITQAIYDALKVPYEEAKLGKHEGGNTKGIQVGDENWYFSGISKRSEQNGVIEAIGFLGGRNENIQHVLLGVDNGLHLDCILTAAVSKQGKVILSSWMDGFTPKSRKVIEGVAHDLDADLWQLSKKDADALHPNNIQWNDHLFITGRFEESGARNAIDASGLTVHTTPLSQNHHLGGGIHCLTKEVYSHTSFDAADCTARLQATGLFVPDGKIQIYNNY